jgi:hypothetical protein
VKLKALTVHWINEASPFSRIAPEGIGSKATDDKYIETGLENPVQNGTLRILLQAEWTISYFKQRPHRLEEVNTAALPPWRSMPRRSSTQ